MHSIKDDSGKLVDSPEEVSSAFVDYYTGLLGSDTNYRIPVKTALVRKGKTLTISQQDILCNPFSDCDIKAALWSIDGNKTPGYDGYSSQFFKDS